MVLKIADECRRLSAQVLLRWAVQQQIGSENIFRRVFLGSKFFLQHWLFFIHFIMKFLLFSSTGVIPKSTNSQHIVSNSKIFDFSLTEHQMAALNRLDKQMHYCWDPKSVIWSLSDRLCQCRMRFWRPSSCRLCEESLVSTMSGRNCFITIFNIFAGSTGAIFLVTRAKMALIENLAICRCLLAERSDQRLTDHGDGSLELART